MYSVNGVQSLEISRTTDMPGLSCVVRPIPAPQPLDPGMHHHVPDCNLLA